MAHWSKQDARWFLQSYEKKIMDLEEKKNQTKKANNN